MHIALISLHFKSLLHIKKKNDMILANTLRTFRHFQGLSVENDKESYNYFNNHH